jgi:hypothetical protein
VSLVIKPDQPQCRLRVQRFVKTVGPFPKTFATPKYRRMPTVKSTLANGAVASALPLWHPPHKSCGTPSLELRATIGGAGICFRRFGVTEAAAAAKLKVAGRPCVGRSLTIPTRD